MLQAKTPEQVIEQLQKIRAEYPDRDIQFGLDTWGHDGGVDLELWETRLQTDSEYERDLEEYAKKQARKRMESQQRKDAEFAEFQRLKKKFER